ncbi:MAG: hypothetical protein KAS81_01310, partial [Anaerolineales bacterium]|nr:hypothetical protein [Anaerolineales bacterium]
DPHPALTPPAHHVSTPARGDPLAARKSVMETIDWWDQELEFRFLSEIRILEPNTALTPAAHHASTLTRSHLIGIENVSLSRVSEFWTLKPRPALPPSITPAAHHASTLTRSGLIGVENVDLSRESEFRTLALGLASTQRTRGRRTTEPA